LPVIYARAGKMTGISPRLSARTNAFPLMFLLQLKIQTHYRQKPQCPTESVCYPSSSASTDSPSCTINSSCSSISCPASKDFTEHGICFPCGPITVDLANFVLFAPPRTRRRSANSPWWHSSFAVNTPALMFWLYSPHPEPATMKQRKSSYADIKIDDIKSSQESAAPLRSGSRAQYVVRCVSQTSGPGDRPNFHDDPHLYFRFAGG
jgi:hypothetical protein